MSLLHTLKRFQMWLQILQDIQIRIGLSSVKKTAEYWLSSVNENDSAHQIENL